MSRATAGHTQSVSTLFCVEVFRWKKFGSMNLRSCPGRRFRMGTLIITKSLKSTVDGVGFFLIEIQLWSIDGSAPAPKLNVVEQPNDWAKIIKRPSGSQGGAAVQFKYDYWTAFNDYAFQNTTFASAFNRHKASSDHWYTLNIGSSEAHISLLVNTKAKVQDVFHHSGLPKELSEVQ